VEGNPTFAHMRDQGQVRAKKHLGQHFLKDEGVAERIAKVTPLDGVHKVLEIGPGMGVMTKYLLAMPDVETWVIEIDGESVSYLQAHYNLLSARILETDFLQWNPASVFGEEPFALVGNFPYNISSQIVFRVLDMRDQIPAFGGMFQKEVAQRLCAPPGSKTYGILSVLVQAYYNAEYLFTVPPGVFNPPPKVDSGVLRLIRKDHLDLGCDDRMFFKVVKTAFNQRRKTLRNSLKSLIPNAIVKEDAIFDKRPEALGVNDFVSLTKILSDDTI